MARQKWAWTDLQEKRAEQVLKVTSDLRDYWPLTLRQIYYQLVKDSLIKNNRSSYNMLSKLVKWMRIDDRLSWSALEDPTRTVSHKRGYEDFDSYLNTALQNFLTGYSRCLVQGQEVYVELWVEKQALYRIFEEVTWMYCIRTVVCKGYNSVTMLADFYKRARRALNRGQQQVVLYFGDLDPSGVQMLEANIETLEEELDLEEVEFQRIALNPEHVKQYNLPSDPTAAKTTDPRYKWYVNRYGNIAVELDALNPGELQSMAHDAIQRVIDMDLFEEQREIDLDERRMVAELRDDVLYYVEERAEELFG